MARALQTPLLSQPNEQHSEAVAQVAPLGVQVRCGKQTSPPAPSSPHRPEQQSLAIAQVPPSAVAVQVVGGVSHIPLPLQKPEQQTSFEMQLASMGPQFGLVAHWPVLLHKLEQHSSFEMQLASIGAQLTSSGSSAASVPSAVVASASTSTSTSTSSPSCVASPVVASVPSTESTVSRVGALLELSSHDAKSKARGIAQRTQSFILIAQPHM